MAYITLLSEYLEQTNDIEVEFVINNQSFLITEGQIQIILSRHSKERHSERVAEDSSNAMKFVKIFVDEAEEWLLRNWRDNEYSVVCLKKRISDFNYGVYLDPRPINPMDKKKRVVVVVTIVKTDGTVFAHPSNIVKQLKNAREDMFPDVNFGDTADFIKAPNKPNANKWSR